MSMRLLLLGAIAAAAMTSAAAAQPDRISTEIVVSDNGVDFSDPAATAGFYAALDAAAHQACDSGMGGRNLTILAEDQRCAAQALDRAVRKTGRSELAALHESKTGRAAPATLLAAQ